MHNKYKKSELQNKYVELVLPRITNNIDFYFSYFISDQSGFLDTSNGELK